MNTVIDGNIIAVAMLNDMVQDVDANASYYTERVLKAVGHYGDSVAFEFSPTVNVQPLTGH